MINLINLVRSNLMYTANTDPDKGAWIPDETTKTFIKEHIDDVVMKTIAYEAKKQAQKLLENKRKQKK